MMNVDILKLKKSKNIMNEFAIYLKGVMPRLGLKSHRQLARILGVSQTYVSELIKGTRFPSDDFVVKVAEVVGDNPAPIILLVQKLKASEKSKPYWDKIMKALMAATIAVFLVVPPVIASYQGVTGYIMLNSD